MDFHRTSAFVALIALAASAGAVAQTPPPSTDPGNTSANSSNPHDSMPNATPANGDSSSPATQSARDPKLQQCLSAEKAKNSGLSENQLTQKCRLQITSEQGQGH
jgi:hypothetical protein